MNDPGLNQLLKWSIDNSESSRSDPSTTTDPKAVRNPVRGLNADALAQILGGPSDADLMKAAMSAIQDPSVPLSSKLTAFDNFEQLIENLDNANNMEPLGLWTPLVAQLQNDEAELRAMAAWCIKTAVQNNLRAQDRLLALGAVPSLVQLALEDSTQAVRKKAVGALSSEVRNYQLGLDTLMAKLPEEFRGDGHVDAGDMEAVDGLIGRLREHASKGD